ncbi:methyltransferase [Microbispora sp. H10830]|uniref:methyltransferase n=1 Tax=Microbispora sp. H10830 TaxID=2729109 RepID=UPI0037C8FD88
MPSRRRPRPVFPDTASRSPLSSPSRFRSAARPWRFWAARAPCSRSRSWARPGAVGVYEGEATALVTTGPFRVARNPIFAAMLTASIGWALLVPSWSALLALAALVVAVQLCRPGRARRLRRSPSVA